MNKTKMLHICYVCLRTNRKLHAVDDFLSNLFDELCDYGVFSDASARFCIECRYMLIKIKNFKKQCRLASETLTKWKKKSQVDRECLDSLSEIMPLPRLSLSDKRNFKIFYYQEIQQITPTDTTYKHPNIITINIPNGETYNDDLNHKLVPLENQVNNTDAFKVKQEDQDTNEKLFIEEVQIDNVKILDNNESRVTKNDCEIGNNVEADDDVIFDAEHIDIDIKSDSNEDDVVLKEIAQKKTTRNVKKVKTDDEKDNEETARKKKSSELSLHELKKVLVKRFINCGGIKDEYGDVIETDVILKNLKDMPLPILRKLKHQVASEYDHAELSPESIKLLAYLYKKYTPKEPKKTTLKKVEVLICKNDDISDDYVSENNYDTTDDHFIKCDIKSDYNTSDDDVIPKKVTKKKNVKRKGKKTLTQSAKIGIDSDGSGDKDKVRKLTDRERRQKISKDELRKRLVKAFGNSGELKDDDGCSIDTELILNSLDDMALRTLRRVKNQLAIKNGKRVLTPDGIRLLSLLQKKFSNEYSNGFTVEHLPTKERMMEEFTKRQFYEKYITAAHKCHMCYTTFRSDTDLTNHIRNAHNEKNQHVCTVCNVRLSKETTLHWHMYKHRTVFKCKMCPFVGYQKGTMITHYNQHKGVIYTCDICNAKFKSRSGHYMHMNKFHETKHTCKLCGKAFVSEHGLRFHQVKKHQSQDSTDIVPGEYSKVATSACKKKIYKKYIACPLCTKREPGVNAMKQHFKSEHPHDSFESHYTVTNNHLCHVCGKAYQSATALNDHKNLHTGARPYTCDICAATFAKKGTLKTHVETHMPPTKECKVCGKKFKGANNLMNHMLYHKPPSKECQMCGKMFSTGSNLYNHMKRHLGERRYKCDICSKSFMDTSARNEHVRGVHNHIRRVRKKRE